MSEDLSKLNLVELVELLQPAPEPTPPSLWPQTEAWIWLALISAIGVALAFRAWRRRRHANAYRRVALAALKDAGDDPAAVASLLRRAALVAYPRQAMASLYGNAWLEFLDQAYGGNGFSNGVGRAVATGPYRPVGEVPGLNALADTWLRRHSRDAA